MKTWIMTHQLLATIIGLAIIAGIITLIMLVKKYGGNFKITENESPDPTKRETVIPSTPMRFNVGMPSMGGMGTGAGARVNSGGIGKGSH